MAPKKRPRSPTPPRAPADNSPEANRFRAMTLDLIMGLGRGGVDDALDTLFAISDLVLNRRYCAQHALNRIVDILEGAHPPSDSESEEA